MVNPEGVWRKEENTHYNTRKSSCRLRAHFKSQSTPSSPPCARLPRTSASASIPNGASHPSSSSSHTTLPFRLRQADHDIGEPEPCSRLASEMGRVRRSYRSNCRRTSAHDTTSARGTGHCGVSPQQLFPGVYAYLGRYDVSG